MKKTKQMSESTIILLRISFRNLRSYIRENKADEVIMTFEYIRGMVSILWYEDYFTEKQRNKLIEILVEYKVYGNYKSNRYVNKKRTVA